VQESSEAPQKRLGRRQKALAAAAGLLAYLAVESFWAPEVQPSVHLCVGLIRAYQATVSPVLTVVGAKCRFTPTCSHYGVGAIRKHGSLAGIGRTALRILRCAPWGPPPGEDPP
jgi:hypothetical protein